jgi:serine/threonine-protein kinase
VNASPALAKDSVILGRFRLIRLLGRGSVADVWLGEPLAGGDPVAVKILHPWVVSEPRVVERFVREAGIAKRLSSPHLCTLREAPRPPPAAGSPLGETKGPPDHGPLALVFDYEDGETLQRRMDRGPIPLADAWRWADELLAGLEIAHAASIVHRDIKPSNLYLTAADPPVVKILDFGIAKLLYESTDAIRGRSLTDEAGLLGSALHMAPEQATSPLSVDGRADTYAAASILFQLLTGRPPFLHASPLVLASLKTSFPPPRLADVRRDTLWPAPLETLFARALATDRAARMATAGELRQTLAATRPLAAALSAPAAYATIVDSTADVFG